MEYKPDKVTVEVLRERDSTETVEDMATALRIIADQIDDGYTSGLFGDLVWDMEREKEDWEKNHLYTVDDAQAILSELTEILNIGDYDPDADAIRTATNRLSDVLSNLEGWHKPPFIY